MFFISVNMDLEGINLFISKLEKECNHIRELTTKCKFLDLFFFNVYQFIIYLLKLFIIFYKKKMIIFYFEILVTK